MTETQTYAPSPHRDRSRILALDVVRGFALCGILLVNLPPIMSLSSIDSAGQPLPIYRFLEDTVQNRFFPIFSFLFGIGFGLMWLGAGRRSARPRLALLRRFAFLGILGGLHQLLQPGEALLPYALAGIVLLLPATWIPARLLGWAASILGAVLLAAGVATGGGLTLIGFATTDYLTRHIHGWINAGLGLSMALTYIAVVLLLLRTPAEVVLKSVFAPLGRMALSNYVGATLILVGVRMVVPDLARLDDHGGYIAGLVICLAIIIVQIIVSTLWLRRFGQGPLEKLWRLVTWGRSARRVQPTAGRLTSSRG